VLDINILSILWYCSDLKYGGKKNMLAIVFYWGRLPGVIDAYDMPLHYSHK